LRSFLGVRERFSFLSLRLGVRERSLLRLWLRSSLLITDLLTSSLSLLSSRESSLSLLAANGFEADSSCAAFLPSSEAASLTAAVPSTPLLLLLSRACVWKDGDSDLRFDDGDFGFGDFDRCEFPLLPFFGDLLLLWRLRSLLDAWSLTSRIRSLRLCYLLSIGGRLEESFAKPCPDDRRFIELS